MAQNTCRVVRFPDDMSQKKSRRRSPIDPHDEPLYTIAQAAYVVGVPVTTLTQWFYGREYVTQGEKRHSDRVLQPADSRRGLLSFTNLGEAHVLEAIRSGGFTLKRIKEAVQMLDQFGSHPLVTWEFYQRGKQLLVTTLTAPDTKEAISVSSPIQGQRLLSDLDIHLERLVRDDSGRLVSLFPVRRNPNKTIMSNLYISEGEPIITGTGILAQFVYERHQTGETVEAIATDYNIPPQAVDDAIRYVSAA